MTIIQKVINIERWMNPLVMTIINPQEKKKKLDRVWGFKLGNCFFFSVIEGVSSFDVIDVFLGIFHENVMTE